MNIIRRIGRISFGVFMVIIGLSFLFAFYSNSLISVNHKSVKYYEELKQTLESKGLTQLGSFVPKKHKITRIFRLLKM